MRLHPQHYLLTPPLWPPSREGEASAPFPSPSLCLTSAAPPSSRDRQVVISAPPVSHFCALGRVRAAYAKSYHLLWLVSLYCSFCSSWGFSFSFHLFGFPSVTLISSIFFPSFVPPRPSPTTRENAAETDRALRARACRSAEHRPSHRTHWARSLCDLDRVRQR